jgi:hypothetical protein
MLKASEFVNTIRRAAASAPRALFTLSTVKSLSVITVPSVAEEFSGAANAAETDELW